MKYKSAVIVLLVIYSCSSGSNQHKVVGEKTNPTTLEHSNDLYQTSEFEGIWAENVDDNAFFIIKGDSIINVEDRDHPFSFKVNNDTMRIYYGESVGIHVVLKVSKDSLILKNEDNSVSKLYKRTK